MNNLDPLPYREMMGVMRFSSRREAPEYKALVFDPRRGYSNDPADYDHLNWPTP